MLAGGRPHWLPPCSATSPPDQISRGGKGGSVGVVPLEFTQPGSAEWLSWCLPLMALPSGPLPRREPLSSLACGDRGAFLPLEVSQEPAPNAGTLYCPAMRGPHSTPL